MNDLVNALKALLFLPAWHAQRLVRRDAHLWIFGAWDGLRYSDNSRAAYEYVRAHHPEIRAVWMTRDQSVYDRMRGEGLDVERVDTPTGRQVMRHASLFVACKGAMDADPRYLNGCHFINLWHGIPLKQIGYDEMAFARKNTPWKRIKTAIRRLIVPYEFLVGETLTTSEFFTPFLQSAFGLRREEVWNVGYPRNDLFFTGQREPLHDELDRRFGHPLKVMYMPTHRDAATKEGHPFNPFELAGFDRDELERVLEERNIVFIYKGHFWDRSNEGITCQRIITVSDSDYDVLYSFIKDIDLLITDYSGMYFDFLLCHKPIILFPFDLEDYIARSRPLYFDYSLLEGKRVYDWHELAAALRDGDYYTPSDETIRRFNTYDDGLSSQRLVERLIQLTSRH